MSAIQMLPLDLQTVPASAPAASPLSLPPGAAAAGGSPFGNVLSNAVNPSSPCFPASVSEIPLATKKATPPIDDDPSPTRNSDHSAYRQPAASAGNDPQPLLESSAAANAAPAENPKAAPPTGGSKSGNTPASSPAARKASPPTDDNQFPTRNPDHSADRQSAASAEKVLQPLLASPAAAANAAPAEHPKAAPPASGSKSEKTPASSPAAGLAKSRLSGTAAGGSRIGHALSKVVNPSPPPVPATSASEVPPAARKAPSPTGANSFPTRNPDHSADPQPAAPAGNDLQSLLASSAVAANAAPAENPKAVPPAGGSNSNDAETAPVPGASPVKLDASLHLSGALAGNTSSTAVAKSAGPPAALVAALNLADQLPATQLEPQADSNPSALAIAGAATSDSKLLAEIATAANDGNSAGAASTSGNDPDPIADAVAKPATPVSATTQLAAVLPAASDTGTSAQPAGGNDSSSAAPPAGAQNSYPLFSMSPGTTGPHAATLAGLQSGAAEVNPAQVIQQVAHAILVTHATGQEMQLQLNPPDLGALSVTVSVHGGVLSARLEAQSQATQQILVDNLSQLKNSLTQQGVAFDRIDVHLAGSPTGSGGSGGSSSTADPSFGRQNGGGLPWEQAQVFAPSETDSSRRTSPAARGPVSRLPLTSLDIMV